MVKVDATGLSCPTPVILLKNEFDKGEKEIELIVDCGAAQENTKRLALSYGYSILGEDNKNGVITIKLMKK
ncbi:sulfurtransferase TusA family protein [Campylobacter sp. RM12327]|nr:sulfurtransferase TusA family protein [Campylobacter sp. RM11302]MBF6668658.1 sulfurtransferase TusA family protein [Campylobacter sp. RM12327]MBF6674086.1 sulfurtransferase TusA family protein [Campylobacter sp. RM13538]MBF6675555.1 sulfurtransferase TusA family protein [Campylobacter sp. RM12321]MBF6677385.1 sulfurtransferase TusA family protein [Campylobacter sp. RM11259]